MIKIFWKWNSISNCDTLSLVNCASTSKGQIGFCTCYTCSENEGNCDSHHECQDGLFCGSNNCPDSYGFENEVDCCTDATCCQNIELVYTSDTPPIEKMRSERFGRYTLSSETVNGRGFYVSDFAHGDYGIWWTGDSDGSWRIGPISYKGQIYGLRAYIDEKCVENINPWNYLSSSGWKSFGSTLSTNCVNTNVNSGGKCHWI